MKEQKTKRKALRSEPVPSQGQAAGNPIKILTESLTELKNENNQIREQFKQLVGMLDKKFSAMGETALEKLTQIRSQQAPQPDPAQQPDPRSEGMLNKKIGDTTVGEALSSLASIARAWQQQSTMDRDTSGVQNLNEFMANIGRTVFEKFVTKEGLDVKAGQQAVEENTAGIS